MTGMAALSAGRIEQTGQRFESLFLSMLLKEMRQSLGEEGLFAGDTNDVHGGLFDLYLGKHLAESGGVGLADAISRMIQPAKADAPAKLHGSAPA